MIGLPTNIWLSIVGSVSGPVKPLIFNSDPNLISAFFFKVASQTVKGQWYSDHQQIDDYTCAIHERFFANNNSDVKMKEWHRVKLQSLHTCKS